jgi:hypothetical protein
VSAALASAALLALAALGAAAVLGWQAASPAETARHVSTGIFATLLVLLSHSLTMFYLVGKGRAVRDAVGEAGLQSDDAARIARVRAPAMRYGMLAVALAMVAALTGAASDAGSIPAPAHTAAALVALAANVHAVFVELRALARAGAIVADLERRLHERG